LPEDINDGDIEIPLVDLDLPACDRLKQFLDDSLRDGERAGQAYWSTVDLALRRHAAAAPESAWDDLVKSIKQQTKDARALYRALSATEAHAHSRPRRREASLLTRAAGVVETRGIPRYRFLSAVARDRVQHDPLGYQAAKLETSALKNVVGSRLRVLALANAAIKTRKGRPRGGVLYPLVITLAGYWKYAAQAAPTYGRREEMWDGPSELEFRSVTTGSFLRYCELALDCLPEDKRHGRRALKSVVRAVCDAGASFKADHTDDLYRI
jgi:hypothetical protein